MPNWNHIVRERLAAIRLPPEREIEIVEELALHLETAYEFALADGLSEAEAEARAAQGYDWRLLECELNCAERPAPARALQPALELMERKGGMRMESFIQDLRFSARMLMKRPAFTLVAMLTLALGIGVNTALFTIFNVFVLQPLPLRDPDSLVEIRGVNPRGARENFFSYIDYLDYRERSRTLAGLALVEIFGVTVGEMRSGRDDVSVWREEFGYSSIQTVTANYFTAVGAEMALGRGFLAEETRAPGTHPVAVLSHFFWQRHFKGDPQVIGKTIKLAGSPFTIIGVTAKEFIGTTPSAPACWIPLMMRDAVIPAGKWNQQRWLTERDANTFLMIGRLQPGVTPAQARAELNIITTQLAAQYPDKRRKVGVTVKNSPGFISLATEDWPPLLILPVSVALALLIACANVANLWLARASQRQKEIGVRLALGASRWRVIRQLLAESVLVAAMGGLAGLSLTLWLLKALYPVVLASLPIPAMMRDSIFLNLAPDYRVFGFTLLMALLAGLAAGLAPALQASRPDLNATLKDEGSTFGLHLSQSRLRNGLIVAQMAVSLTLLVSAGLLARSLLKLQTVDTGIQVRNLFSVVADLSEPNPQRQVELRRQLADRLRALPAVQSVSQALRQPLSGAAAVTPITLDEQAYDPDRPLSAKYNFVSPTHLTTLGIPLVRGRNFTEQEANSGAPVVVISESTAQELWPQLKDPGAAIGKHIGIGAAAPKADADNPQAKTGPIAKNFPQYEVIGVADNTRSGRATQPDETFLYAPLKPDSSLGEYLLVRTTGEPQSVMAAVRGEAAALDPRLNVVVQRTAEHLQFQMIPFRVAASMAATLGLLALFLATVGLYGVMSFVVTQRTREIGIRISLGAEPRAVVALILRQGLRLIVYGVALGLAGGAGISRLLAAALVDLSPLDPLAFGGVSACLTLVALLACWIPARRATKVDPLTALRHE
jgi:putative ABC transport system permease protein